LEIGATSEIRKKLETMIMKMISPTRLSLRWAFYVAAAATEAANCTQRGAR
jgi:hypothetical protein